MVFVLHDEGIQHQEVLQAVRLLYAGQSFTAQTTTSMSHCGLVCGAHRVPNEIEYLEETQRRSASLSNVARICRYPKWRWKDEQLCSWEQCREKRHTVLCSRRVLPQEEDWAVRQYRRWVIMRVMARLWMHLGEVMHQVWTRHC